MYIFTVQFILYQLYNANQQNLYYLLSNDFLLLPLLALHVHLVLGAEELEPGEIWKHGLCINLEYRYLPDIQAAALPELCLQSCLYLQ